jgi:transposase
VRIDEEMVVRARPRRRDVSRCGLCGRRAPGYDRGEGRRRWRALDLGRTKAFVEAAAPRVECRQHGVVVARVPWARHGSWFTREFEDQVAWLATHCSKSAVCELILDPPRRRRFELIGVVARRSGAGSRVGVGFGPPERYVRVGGDVGPAFSGSGDRAEWRTAC